MLRRYALWLLLALWLFVPGLTKTPAALTSDQAASSLDIVLDVEENLEAPADPLQAPVHFLMKAAQDASPLAMLSRPSAPALSRILKWQIQLFDFDDRKVDYLQGQGQPRTLRLPWRGITRQGQLLRDGFYRARLVWQDDAGTHQSPSISVSFLSMQDLRELARRGVSLAYADNGLIIRIGEELTFAPGSWQLRHDAFTLLTEVGSFLRKYPQNRIVVQGHTDSTGPAAANLRLSVDRAKALYQYLLASGIDSRRIAYQGLGPSQPIATNDTKEGRLKNRRVDIRMLPSRTSA